MDADAEEEARVIAAFQFKRKLDLLRAARGAGTSLVSLILPPGAQIALTHKMLVEESGTAANIKSRVNRQSVQDAIQAAQSALPKTPGAKAPPNGLAVFAGTVELPDGRTRRVTVAFEPPRPLQTSLYRCDSSFHIEALLHLCDDAERFGFLVLGGDGVLFGLLQGSARTVLRAESVSLPRKHNKGGQSSVRFERLRTEAVHVWLAKVGEMATRYFVPNGATPSIKGLVLAGAAEMKSKLVSARLLDPRLSSLVVATVDRGTGGAGGCGRGGADPAAVVGGHALIRQKALLARFAEEIATAPPVGGAKYCFGVADTMAALEAGAVDTLLVWDALPTRRLEVRGGGGSVSVTHCAPADAAAAAAAAPADAAVEEAPLVEWLAEHYRDFGARLCLLSDASPEGTQFARGFGGLGAVLKYAVDFGVGQEHELAPPADAVGDGGADAARRDRGDEEYDFM
jgi:peptide chain release factor subunit 1